MGIEAAGEAAEASAADEAAGAEGSAAEEDPAAVGAASAAEEEGIKTPLRPFGRAFCGGGCGVFSFGVCGARGPIPMDCTRQGFCIGIIASCTARDIYLSTTSVEVPIPRAKNSRRGSVTGRPDVIRQPDPFDHARQGKNWRRGVGWELPSSALSHSHSSLPCRSFRPSSSSLDSSRFSRPHTPLVSASLLSSTRPACPKKRLLHSSSPRDSLSQPGHVIEERRIQEHGQSGSETPGRLRYALPPPLPLERKQNAPKHRISRTGG